MKKYFTLPVIIGMLSSCVSTAVKFGVYSSECRLYTRSEIKLHIKPDSTFQYYFAYNEEVISGKWEIKKDTLFLYSKKFSEKREQLSPAIKNSDIKGKDAYIVKGRTLKIINQSGVSENCPLKLSK